MDFAEIRCAVIAALFSDDQLYERLVLKGGNALELIHRVLTRGSTDIDLSIQDEFANLEDVKARIFNALEREFGSHGYLVFDKRFEVVPPESIVDATPWWGGYTVEFKLIDVGLADRLMRNLERMRIQAQTIDAVQGRVFRVEISKREYCGGKVQAEVDGQAIYVYTEEMCVVEKLRAICQQMPAYGRKHPTPRARDFYDIYTTITLRGIDLSLPDNTDLFRQIFHAKRVPLLLLASMDETREFHRPDWAAIKDTVKGEVFDFDFYFDFVLEEVARLQALWEK